MEADSDAVTLALDCGNVQAFTHGFEDSVLQKVFYRGGRRAEAVGEFAVNILLFFIAGDRGDAFVGAQAQVFAGDVVFWDAHVEAEAQSGAQLGGGFFAL